MRKDRIYDPCERVYICLDCGEVFSEPSEFYETHGFQDHHYHETFTQCPKCGGDYEEAVECERCGEYVAESMSENCLCAKCRGAVWREFVKLMGDNFSPNEREYIYSQWEFEGDCE